MSKEKTLSSIRQDFFNAKIMSFEQAEKHAMRHAAKTKTENNGKKPNPDLFISDNEKSFRTEIDNLLKSLQYGDIDGDIFLFFAYTCVCYMQIYFEAYGQKDKVDDCIKRRIEIKKWQKDGKRPGEQGQFTKDIFFTYLRKKIAADLMELLKTPTRVTTIRNLVSIANINRIYWFFCKTTVAKSLLLARDLHWLDRLSSVLGKTIDADEIIDMLQKPNPVLKGLSVGFFAFRFILNAAMLIKHTYGSDQERALTKNWHERLFKELYKRHPVMINDVVWGSVNFLTNYNFLFGIPDPTAGWIIAGFLVFDFCLIVWQRHLAEREYLAKKRELLNDREYYYIQLKPRKMDGEPLTLEERKEIEQHIKLLTEELAQLDISWQADSATFWFNGIAALLLAAGFTASMVLSPPVVILACYAICMFGVAMYLSAGAYKNYKEKSLQLEHAQLNGRDTVELLKAYQAARNEFILTMAKNVLLPTLFIATFAICWQAAVVLVALYVGYKLYCAYSDYLEKRKGEGKITLKSPYEDEIELLEKNDERCSNEDSGTGERSSFLELKGAT